MEIDEKNDEKSEEYWNEFVKAFYTKRKRDILKCNILIINSVYRGWCIMK
jgi:N-glycosylase/DNA lyase